MLATPLSPIWNDPAVDRFNIAVGGRVVTDAYGPGIEFDASPLPLSADWIAPLPDLGLLTVSGADAAKFLHAQLTNDIEHLAPGVVRWNGYCSAKGRLLSTFRNWRDEQTLHLTVSRPLADTIRRRLTMFVLRAKARVEDSSDSVAIYGLLGDRVAESAAAAFGLTAGNMTSFGMPVPTEGHSGSLSGIHLVGLPSIQSDGVERRRYLLVVPLDRAAEA